MVAAAAAMPAGLARAAAATKPGSQGKQPMPSHCPLSASDTCQDSVRCGDGVTIRKVRRRYEGLGWLGGVR